MRKRSVRRRTARRMRGGANANANANAIAKANAIALFTSFNIVEIPITGYTGNMTLINKLEKKDDLFPFNIPMSDLEITHAHIDDKKKGLLIYCSTNKDITINDKLTLKNGTKVFCIIIPLNPLDLKERDITGLLTVTQNDDTNKIIIIKS